MLRRPGLLVRERRAALAARRRSAAVERHLVGEGFRLRGHGSQPTLAPWRSRSSASPASRAGSCSTRRGEPGSTCASSAGGVKRWTSLPRRARRCALQTRAARRTRSGQRARAATSSSRVAGPFLEIGMGPVLGAIAVGAALSRHERRAGVGEAPARAGRERRSGARAGLRLRLRPGRHRGAAGRRAGRGAARRDRRRLLGQGCRHEPGHAADDRPRDRAEAGRLGGRPARSVRVRRDDRAACASRSASERSSSGAGPSRSRCRATRTSATCARTSARPPSPAGWAGLGQAGGALRARRVALRPGGAVRRVARQEQVRRRRRGARARRRRARRGRGERRLRPDGGACSSAARRC